jgi:hypothetical protein
MEDRKIDLLARIFAQALTDDARIDDATLLIGAIKELDGPHLRMMAILASPAPPYRFIDDNPRSEVTEWARGNILRCAPELEAAYDLLVAKLQTIGFAAQTDDLKADEPVWRLTAAGRNAARFLLDRDATTGAA